MTDQARRVFTPLRQDVIIHEEIKADHYGGDAYDRILPTDEPYLEAELLFEWEVPPREDEWEVWCAGFMWPAFVRYRIDSFRRVDGMRGGIPIVTTIPQASLTLRSFIGGLPPLRMPMPRDGFRVMAIRPVSRLAQAEGLE